MKKNKNILMLIFSIFLLLVFVIVYNNYESFTIGGSSNLKNKNTIESLERQIARRQRDLQSYGGALAYRAAMATGARSLEELERAKTELEAQGLMTEDDYATQALISQQTDPALRNLLIRGMDLSLQQRQQRRQRQQTQPQQSEPIYDPSMSAFQEPVQVQESDRDRKIREAEDRISQIRLPPGIEIPDYERQTILQEIRDEAMREVNSQQASVLPTQPGKGFSFSQAATAADRYRGQIQDAFSRSELNAYSNKNISRDELSQSFEEVTSHGYNRNRGFFNTRPYTSMPHVGRTPKRFGNFQPQPSAPLPELLQDPIQASQPRKLVESPKPAPPRNETLLAEPVFSEPVMARPVNPSLRRRLPRPRTPDMEPVMARPVAQGRLSRPRTPERQHGMTRAGLPRPRTLDRQHGITRAGLPRPRSP